ncbi:MAG: protocatechuate 3,4-dioxygenase [Pyrinomonadaceae bacterium]
MNNNDRKFSRRELLQMSAGLAGLAFTGSVLGQSRALTPEIQMGPFYPMVKPLDKDADMTMLAGHKKRALGEIVEVVGKVVNGNGDPVNGARIEIWQANAAGRYSHGADTNTAPLDPDFQGFAVVTTDAMGRYRFKTVKPGAYPATPTWKRPPHIHVDIFGKTDRLVSQMFFPGEDLNEKDSIFLELGSDKAAALASVLPATADIEKGAILLNWDIVLNKG